MPKKVRIRTKVWALQILLHGSLPPAPPKSGHILGGRKQALDLNLTVLNLILIANHALILILTVLNLILIANHALSIELPTLDI